MKIFTAAILVFITGNLYCQTKNIKEIILTQIDSLIYYSPRILGKTFYQFYSQGRPNGFSEELFGDWEMNVMEPDNKNQYEKFVVMTDFDAQATMFFNTKTHLSYAIDINPSTWVSVDELNLHLKNRYGLDERGNSNVQNAVDSKLSCFSFDIKGKIPHVLIFNCNQNGKALYFDND